MPNDVVSAAHYGRVSQLFAAKDEHFFDETNDGLPVHDIQEEGDECLIDKAVIKIVTSFRKNGRGKPMYLKVQLSFSKDEDKALNGAYDQWRTNIFSGAVLGDLWKVEHFDALGEMVHPEEMKSKVLISSHVEQYKVDTGIH